MLCEYSSLYYLVMTRPVRITKRYVRNLVQELNRYCFTAGSEKYAREKNIEISPETMKPILTTRQGYIEFAKYVNWSYKEAQRIIIRTRLRVERATKAGIIEYEEPYNEIYIISLLTDYADCIAWVMLKHDISAARNVFLEPKRPSRLDNQNWESIQKALDYYNKDPNQFALATDLTSFFQVGDLYCLNSQKMETYKIEVKTGDVNDRIIEAMSANDIDQFKAKTAEILKQAKDFQKTSKHISRTMRQYQRAVTTLDYGGLGTTKRTELRTGRPVDIHEERGRDEESWSHAVLDVAKSLKRGGVASGWVDYCIFFMYGRRRLTNIDLGFFRYRINQHFDLGLDAQEAELLPIFKSHMMLGVPTINPRSLLFLKLGEERQKRLMAGDDYLLVYLHVPALKFFLKQHGFDLTLRNAQQGDQPYVDKFLRELFGRNKMPEISTIVDGETYGWTLLSGTWSRIIFDFMAPMELVNYSTTIIKSQAHNSKRKHGKNG